MKNKIFTNAIFMFVILTCLCVNKAFSCTYCIPETTYETPFAKMTDDKHYIKPGSIVFSADGLFLLMQGHLIPINCLEEDESGVFIRPQAYELRTCPNCSWPLTPGGICLNWNCPLSPYYNPD